MCILLKNGSIFDQLVTFFTFWFWIVFFDCLEGNAGDSLSSLLLISHSCLLFKRSSYQSGFLGHFLRILAILSRLLRLQNWPFVLLFFRPYKQLAWGRKNGTAAAVAAVISPSQWQSCHTTRDSTKSSASKMRGCTRSHNRFLEIIFFWESSNLLIWKWIVTRNEFSIS